MAGDTGDTGDRVLTEIDRRDVDLPDRLRWKKIRDRAFGFEFEPDESLSFHLERHPTMYLSDGGVPGLDTSPARFHVHKEYRLDLSDETWTVEEHDARFEREPWMIREAELGESIGSMLLPRQIEDVRDADDPEAAFEDEFGSVIDYWEDKFDDVHGRKVPPEDRDAIVTLLVDALKERTGVESYSR